MNLENEAFLGDFNFDFLLILTYCTSVFLEVYDIHVSLPYVYSTRLQFCQSSPHFCLSPKLPEAILVCSCTGRSDAALPPRSSESASTATLQRCNCI